GFSSSWARRSRCARWPSCRARRSRRAARWPSSTGARRRGTPVRRSRSTPARAKRCARSRPHSISSRSTDRGGAMAERRQDLLGRLADLSEEAVQRLAEAPGADRVLQALKGLADRVDDLQRRTRGFEELEGRLTTLEKRVDALAKPKPPASGSRTRTPKSGSTPEKP